ncbi:MAG: barstar family protein [Pseudomonadota bacterium]
MGSPVDVNGRSFEFVDQENTAGSFVVDVPGGLQSKRELLETLATAGQFPDYFGCNWDALLDCLSDFGWIEERRIVIRHADLPSRHSLEDCRTYLQILGESVRYWARAAGQPTAEHVMQPSHELRVVFPSSAREEHSSI